MRKNTWKIHFWCEWKTSSFKKCKSENTTFHVNSRKCKQCKSKTIFYANKNNTKCNSKKIKEYEKLKIACGMSFACHFFGHAHLFDIHVQWLWFASPIFVFFYSFENCELPICHALCCCFLECVIHLFLRRFFIFYMFGSDLHCFTFVKFVYHFLHVQKMFFASQSQVFHFLHFQICVWPVTFFCSL